jgi:hypothetical protein
MKKETELKNYLHYIGISEMEELQFCDEECVHTISSHLKKIPEKPFRHCMNLVLHGSVKE